jgi:hypothetical protein
MVKILNKNVLLKSLLFVFTCLAFGMQANAQTFSDRVSGDIGRKVRFGFKIDPGVSIMRPQENGIERNGGKFYFSYGVMADFFLDESGNYAIASGLQISHMGSVLMYDAGKGLDKFKAAPTEYDLRLQYVEVPFALKLKTNTSSGIGIWGQFGGFAGFPVRARANVISGLVKYEKENVLRDITPINAGLLLGAGIEYPLTETLTGIVGFNFQNGFVDATKNGKWDDGKVNINSFIVRLGVYF